MAVFVGVVRETCRAALRFNVVGGIAVRPIQFSIGAKVNPRYQVGRYRLWRDDWLVPDF